MSKQSKPNKTRWHRLLGTLLEQLLTPVGISVQCDVKLMSNPPEADILLLRRQTPHWTKEQLALLADGIRDSDASDILLEFKYTESVNDAAMQQTLAYDFFYKRANKLAQKQVQSFLLSAKTPNRAFLERFGYHQGQHRGVYISTMPLEEHVILIVLNELSDEAHNVWLKCFASRRLEKQKAFEAMNAAGLSFISERLEFLLSGLWNLWFSDKGEFEMSAELTSEKVMEMGRFWGKSCLPFLDAKERLEGLDEKEILSVVNHQKLLAELSVAEIEAYLQKVKSSHNE